MQRKSATPQETLAAEPTRDGAATNSGQNAGNEGKSTPMHGPLNVVRSLEVGLLLATGTTLALLAQVVTNMRAVDPKAQFLAWVKYLFAVCLSWLGGKAAGSKSAAPTSKKTERGMLLLGFVDTFAYSMNCIGFAYCGSAWATVIFAAMAPTFTALMSKFVLRKHLQTQQIAAVVLVVCGLLTSAIPKLWSTNRKPTGVALTSNLQALGAVAVVCACLSYSLLGVLYEKLIAGESQPPSHAQIVQKMSIVGLVSMTAFQIGYTLPRRSELILEPISKSGTPLFYIVVGHVLFGAVFALHSHAQSRVFRSQGAIGVGIVNSVRGAVVTGLSALLFCSPATPYQCLNLYSATGAVVVTVGGIVWATVRKGGKQEHKKES